MRKALWYLQNLRLVERNRIWWKSDLSLRLKLSYYLRIIESALWFAMTGRREVAYLGRRFRFDNPATLLNLQAYPYEVSHMILRHVDDMRSIRTILDVGGNIGQFAATMYHFLPHAAIDVVEPNPQALGYLRDNLAAQRSTEIYPYALSRRPTAALHFEPDRSATASLFAENVGGLWDSTTISIATADDVPALTGRSSYDLVKVDVESAEFEVVKCLRGLSVRYLFIELSTGRRAQPYLHSQMFEQLRELFGEFDILAQDEIGEGASSFDVLVRFSEPKP